MAIKNDVLQEICAVARLQIQDLYPEFKTVFVPHENGTLEDIVSSKDYELPKHPAASIATTILEKNAHRDQTGFIGLAIATEKKWFGLSGTDKIMGVININKDEFLGARDFRRAIYHSLWHAIDLMEVRKRPEFSGKFKSGPMIPKRSPMNLARLNLQADAFSSTMCALLGEMDSIEILAKKRAMDSIMPSGYRKTEDYPFPIALETMDYAFAEVKSLKPAKTKYMYYARHLAFEVGRTFDDASIRQWWAFAEPAQEMAWQNFTPETILGCAIHTSDDPFVRSVGLLVSDLSGKYPLKPSEDYAEFNAFAKHEKTKALHREMVEKAFEDAVARGTYEESGQPLIMAANKQNEALSNGQFLGWCAVALQAAARAFEHALKSGAPPAQAARMEFEGGKNNPEFEEIQKIGRAAVDQKRKGNAMTLGNIAEICTHNPDLAPVLKSIKMTMADPAFVQKLEQANDFMPKGPAREKTPAPKMPAPTPMAAPSAPAFTAPAPGLGGNGNRVAAQAAAMRKAAMASAKEKAEVKETDEQR